jgi:hypothetical protein
MVIHDDLHWFLTKASNQSIEDIERTIVTQSNLLNFIASFEKDVYRHYRKDVSNSDTSNSMVLHMRRQPIITLAAANKC